MSEVDSMIAAFELMGTTQQATRATDVPAKAARPVMGGTDYLVNMSDEDYTSAEPVDTTVEDDYQFAKGNLYAAIERGMRMLDEISKLARTIEHPRAYEVANAILKNVVDVNKDLLDLAKKKKDLEPKAEGPSSVTTNNNLFVSTAELQDMIMNAKKNG